MDVTFGLGDPAFFELLDDRPGGRGHRDDGPAIEDAGFVREARAFLPHVDYVLPNDAQALLMSGAADVPGRAAAALLADGPRGVLVTLGGAGSLVVTEAGDRAGAGAQDGRGDTTGCGDAYCAGFITGLLHGQDVLAAARWGTAAAAQSPRRPRLGRRPDGPRHALALPPDLLA